MAVTIILEKLRAAKKPGREKEINVEKAVVSDCSEILTLQKLAYISEAEIYNDYSIPPLVQTLHEIESEFGKMIFLKIVFGEKIIGSVRGFTESGTCFIEKLIVHPEFQGQGLGKKLIGEIERVFSNCNRFELFTGHKSEKNLYLYIKLGYKIFKTSKVATKLSFVFLEKC